MLGDEPTAAGVAYLPIVGEWEIEEGAGPFIVFGRHDIGETALIGRIGSSGGGGGDMIYFTITEVDCPEGTGYWAVDIMEYTGGCKTPPGKDADSDPATYTVRPMACGNPFTSADLVGGVGWAVFVYPLGDCENGHWREIIHCADDGC
jgi:hypothetical protein